MEAVVASVQMVGREVDRESVQPAVKEELPPRYAVGVAAGGLAGSRAVAEITVDVGIAHYNVVKAAGAVGHCHGDYPRSDFREGHLGAR